MPTDGPQKLEYSKKKATPRLSLGQWPLFFVALAIISFVASIYIPASELPGKLSVTKPPSFRYALLVAAFPGTISGLISIFMLTRVHWTRESGSELAILLLALSISLAGIGVGVLATLVVMVRG